MSTLTPSFIGILTSANVRWLRVPKLICAEVDEIFQNLCRCSCAEVHPCRSPFTRKMSNQVVPTDSRTKRCVDPWLKQWSLLANVKKRKWPMFYKTSRHEIFDTVYFGNRPLLHRPVLHSVANFWKPGENQYRNNFQKQFHYRFESLQFHSM